MTIFKIFFSQLYESWWHMVDCVIKLMQWSPGKILGSLMFPLHHSIA